MPLLQLWVLRGSVIAMLMVWAPMARASLISGNPETGGVSLIWEANTESDVLGYRVHFGLTSRTYATTLDVGNQKQTRIDDLPSGATYYCAVTAYNAEGLESPYSEELSFTVGDADQDGLPDDFEASFSDTGDLDPEADLNGDGLPVLAEYAHGLDPRSSGNRIFHWIGPVALADGKRHLGILYRIDPSAERFVTIHVERSVDLRNPEGWQRGGTRVVSSRDLADGSGMVEVSTHSLTPMSGQPREFLRLAYEATAP